MEVQYRTVSGCVWIMHAQGQAGRLLLRIGEIGIRYLESTARYSAAATSWHCGRAVEGGSSPPRAVLGLSPMPQCPRASLPQPSHPPIWVPIGSAMTSRTPPQLPELQFQRAPCPSVWEPLPPSLESPHRRYQLTTNSARSGPKGSW